MNNHIWRHAYLMDRMEIVNEIIDERKYQDETHDFPEPLRMAILAEEVGEVASALQNGNTDYLIEELVQVAAVAMRWIEHLREEEQ